MTLGSKLKVTFFCPIVYILFSTLSTLLSENLILVGSNPLKEVMKNLKPAIKYTLQMITSVLVALEIATPPNPYKVHIIVCLTLLIALKYDWPSKIEKSLNKIVVTLLNLFWKSPRL